MILDRTPERLSAWLERHQRAQLDAAARVEVARLRELQRGELAVRDASLLPARAAAPMVEIDTAAIRLVWSGEERREASPR